MNLFHYRTTQQHPLAWMAESLVLMYIFARNWEFSSVMLYSSVSQLSHTWSFVFSKDICGHPPRLSRSFHLLTWNVFEWPFVLADLKVTKSSMRKEEKARWGQCPWCRHPTVQSPLWFSSQWAIRDEGEVRQEQNMLRGKYHNSEECSLWSYFWNGGEIIHSISCICIHSLPRAIKPSLFFWFLLTASSFAVCVFGQISTLCHVVVGSYLLWS